MKTFEEMKKALTEKRQNIKGFNKDFYKIFCKEMETAQKAIEEANENGGNFNITEFWQGSETHKTYFYNNNGACYCALLEIL